MAAHCIHIVEDDTELGQMMHQYMVQSGYEAHVSESAEQALELIKSTPVDVIITDIRLPGINGLKLTDILKQQYDIDIIIMTGHGWEYSYEEAINKGASDFVCKPVRLEELLLRIKRVLTERQYRKERKQMLAELKKLSITDDLTKLHNSRHFYKQLEIEVQRAMRYHHPLTLLLMDIDHFKKYNDTYGHLEGDKVLAGIGLVLKSCLRANDTAYRYGGEEFTILFPETGLVNAQIVADRVKSIVQAQKFSPVPDAEASVTASIGLTEYQRGEAIREFIKRSDQAMYLSKARGRNSITVLPP